MASPELEKLYEEATGPGVASKESDSKNQSQDGKDKEEQVEPGKEPQEEAFLAALQNSRSLGELAKVTQDYSVNEPLLKDEAVKIKNRVPAADIIDLFHLNQFYETLLKEELNNSGN